MVVAPMTLNDRRPPIDASVPLVAVVVAVPIPHVATAFDLVIHVGTLVSGLGPLKQTVGGFVFEELLDVVYERPARDAARKARLRSASDALGA